MSYMNSDAGIALIISLIMMLIVAIICIALYIAIAIPIYQMAKNRGIDKAWLTFVPLGTNYILGKLADKDLNLFNIVRIGKDTVPITSVLLPVISIPLAFLSIIPILGWLISLAVIVVTYAYMICLYKAIYEDYYENTTAWILAVLSLFIGFLFVVVFWMIRNKPRTYHVERPYSKGITFTFGNNQPYTYNGPINFGGPVHNQNMNGYGHDNNMNNYGQRPVNNGQTVNITKQRPVNINNQPFDDNGYN